MVPRTPTDVALYGHFSCPYSTRVSFALAERAVPHELIEVPPSALRPADFVLPDAFVAHSPRLEIPLVRVGDDHLADSLPIIAWLDQVGDARPLVPEDPARRAVALEATRIVDEVVFPAMIGIYYGVEDRRIAAASAALAAASVAVGDLLDGHEFLAGDEITIADAALVPLWVRLELLETVGFAHDLDDRARAHREALRHRPAFAAVAWSEDERDILAAAIEAARRRGRRGGRSATFRS
jgi:glutathione S-transferase